MVSGVHQVVIYYAGPPRRVSSDITHCLCQLTQERSVLASSNLVHSFSVTGVTVLLFEVNRS